jgi:hypothetical protein
MTNICITLQRSIAECLPFISNERDKTTETYVFEINNELAAEICLHEYRSPESYQHLQKLVDIPHYECFELSQLIANSLHCVEIKIVHHDKFYVYLPVLLDMCLTETGFQDIVHFHALLSHQQLSTPIRNICIEFLERHKFLVIDANVPFHGFVKAFGTKDQSLINYAHVYGIV